jgi:uncharacterized protein (TIGR00255 family)
MTAYANRDIEIPGGIARWEIRSINHRYLEPSFKLPEALRDLEYKLRELIRNHLSRGKVDCVLKIDQSDENKNVPVIDYQLIDELSMASKKIMERFSSNISISLFDVLHWPSVIKIPEQALVNLIDPLQKSFVVVLQDLLEARAREGVKLKECIEARLVQMRDRTHKIKARMPEIQKEFRFKFQEKLDKLLMEIDQNRLEQEMIYLVQKMDISEELDRLSTHLTEVERVLTKDNVVGRRLDFLMQELNRETNTIASKSIDHTTIQDAIDLKVLIEEMREQIQNLE